ncbi:uncharacterized protein LY79DRAFT_123815 [Colletotrichum navitas]|uniref:Uncharacterized protein n=1 Tax=Colletotrichum navitas TaxID=681940 RepID=A0AAD8V6E2_9PEZI|nr:uncharacterized protein LY79DRAFT_123815 [Colletotrichum navitas]KAK1594724.1 hypothetical protein LY79DRAFT_123815 [Colletotrichum navitas]
MNQPPRQHALVPHTLIVHTRTHTHTHTHTHTQITSSGTTRHIRRPTARGIALIFITHPHPSFLTLSTLHRVALVPLRPPRLFQKSVLNHPTPGHPYPCSDLLAVLTFKWPCPSRPAHLDSRHARAYLTATDKVVAGFPFALEASSSNTSFRATPIAPTIFGVSSPRLLRPSVSLQTVPPLIIITFVAAFFVCTIQPPPPPPSPCLGPSPKSFLHLNF